MNNLEVNNRISERLHKLLQYTLWSDEYSNKVLF